MKTELSKIAQDLDQGTITENEAKSLLLSLLGVMPRFFVDLRSGCGAVRDRLHPDFDADYQGLHNDTIDVIEYKHGFQNSEINSWDMKQEDINFLNERCASLNGA